MLVFDIGFHDGNFSKEILSYYPDAKIIGVEGHPGFVEKYNNAKVPNVEVLNNVVSNTNDVSTSFYVCDINPGINSINVEWMQRIRHNHFFHKSMREISIKSITLDYMIEKYGSPDIIKLDIEGAELMALEGLSLKCGTVLYEFSEEFFDNAVKCADRLKSIGYTKFGYQVLKELETQSCEYDRYLYYQNWEDLVLHKVMQKDRKLLWGMIYAK